MRWFNLLCAVAFWWSPSSLAAQTGEPGKEALFLPAGPLSADQVSTFSASREDPAPEKLLGVSEKYEDSHFVAGNEWNLQVFEPHVRALGGAYMGVGADQAYIIMGWMRPELAWLMDYDDHVVYIHRLHQLFFEAATTAEEYLHLWSKDGSEAARQLITDRFADALQRKRCLHRYANSAGRVHRRLQRVVKRLLIPFYLTDARQYEYLRTMWLEGRIRTLRANLLASDGVVGIAGAARQLGIPIRAAYFSNAEEYWDYGPEFRNNIRAIPADDRSVVLRTRGTWESNRDYRYIVQPLQNFQDVLSVKRIKSLARYVGRPRVKGHGKADIMVLEVDLTLPEGTQP